MTYVLIALAVLVIISGVFAYIFYKMYRKFKNCYEKEHLKLVNLQEEYSKLAEAYKIKKENKEKADEKISNLHSGDSVANAINILRK
jgi:3-isopropylmalate dehydratase small subunit